MEQKTNLVVGTCDTKHAELGFPAENIRRAVAPPVQLTEIPAHINDREFADAVLRVLDDGFNEGIVGDKADWSPADCGRPRPPPS